MAQADHCVFCQIARKEVKSEILYEGEDLVAFKDVNPKAPVHFQIIPRKHIKTHLELEEADRGWLAEAHFVANRLAKDLKIDGEGFRLVVNCGEGAGQSVNHFHMHVMGGRVFRWPPG